MFIALAMNFVGCLLLFSSAFVLFCLFVVCCLCCKRLEFVGWLQAGSGAEGITKTLMQQCEQFAAKLLEDEVALYKTRE